MEQQYRPPTIEQQVQQFWEKQHCFEATDNPKKEKFYCLSMLPYPSGRLHMGHVRNYTIGDVIARYQRMMGKVVLQPMGWDAFGLPAENAAILNHIPPAQWTRQNICEMRKQMMALGWGYDWSREITTCDPSYYHWEQWFFLKLYQKGLVYKKKAVVNWDPVDQTILANEQVIDGRGWRSGAVVERREIAQWFLKITAYAEELLNDLDTLSGWPEEVKTMQRNWIGRSEGITLRFALSGTEDRSLSIYTTRPDTLFGVTYIALAADHPLALQYAEQDAALRAFIESCRHMKVSEEALSTAPKQGMLLPITAIHPLTQATLPIWVANFVLMEYGTGAVMAVPAHDERDRDFAKQYHLPIKSVIEDNQLVDSGKFTGLSVEEGKKAIADDLISQHLGERTIHYRLRDWSISRQRYWGAPIPIIYCDECGMQPVPQDHLPVVLPEEVNFSGVTSPLRTMPEFVNTPCPLCQKPAKRETDTFDTFIESSWYYARYTTQQRAQGMLDQEANYWLPVDQYVGGIEHAVLHLLYARFFHKLMRDEGLLQSNEPFTRLLTQGMVLYQGSKMSKSKGNVVDPEPYLKEYGADTVRLFMMFAAPPTQNLEWSDSGVQGAHRFLKRLWALAYQECELIKAHQAQAHGLFSTVAWTEVPAAQVAAYRQMGVSLEQAKRDYEQQQYNTVVSGCMKIFNILTELKPSTEGQDLRGPLIYQGMSILLRLLAPITPHITHQLWEALHFEGLILDATWPQLPSISLQTDTVSLVVQVNGKLRGRIQVATNADRTVIEHTAQSDDNVKRFLQEGHVKKIIIVPGKLVNIVTDEA
jgi:leucyl-tRNA synthetase